jgi:hypothetical protein
LGLSEKGGFMAKAILMDEIHVTLFAPRGLREEEYDVIHRTLTDRRFRRDLRRTVGEVVRRYPASQMVRVSVTR